MPIFTEALFTVDKIYKKTYMSSNSWVEKDIYICIKIKIGIYEYINGILHSHLKS